MIPRNTPQPTIPDAVTLQWANGKPVARRTEASKFAPYTGFHIEVGKDSALDDILTTAKYQQIQIRHQRPGGAAIVAHWDLGASILLLPITAGPVASTIAASLANGNARATADAGLGLRWGRGDRSRMAVRGFVKGLWDAGYRRPVQLATRSRMTDILLAVLLDHTRAAAAVDGLIDRQRHPDPVSPAELWLPLVPGEETEFGKDDTATVTPFASGHPVELTAEYLRTAWAGSALYQAAGEAWSLIKAWAHDYAAHGGEEVEAPTEEPAL